MRRSFVLLVLLLVGGLIAAVYLLRVDEVRVTGLRTLPARAIIDASELRPGDRILWERLTAAERRIEQMPAVDDAVAERVLPSTVVIHVRERVPIARLDGATQLAVDAEGVMFPVGQAEVKPVLFGWKGADGSTKARPGSRVDQSSAIVLDAWQRFPGFLQEWGRRLRVGKTFELTLLGGIEVRFGVLRDLESKAAVAEAVIEREKKKGEDLAYVDVRSPTVPVARSVATPPPASPPPAGSAPPAAPATPVATPAPSPAR
jgi:cell division septal protein FtsQ